MGKCYWGKFVDGRQVDVQGKLWLLATTDGFEELKWFDDWPVFMFEFVSEEVVRLSWGDDEYRALVRFPREWRSDVLEAFREEAMVLWLADADGDRRHQLHWFARDPQRPGGGGGGRQGRAQRASAAR